MCIDSLFSKDSLSISNRLPNSFIYFNCVFIHTLQRWNLSFFPVCHVIFTFGDILHLLLIGALDFPLGTEASNERPNKPLNEALHKLTLITNLGFVVV